MAAEAIVSPEIVVFDPDEYILLVPFGGQLEPKINREFMANGIPVIRAEMTPEGEVDLTDVDLSKARGVVLSGGNDSVYADNSRRVPTSIMDLMVPKLGICYGEQAMIHELGGTVAPSAAGEHGPTDITISPNPLFAGVPGETLEVLMNHRDVVVGLPPGFTSIAESPAGIAGATNGSDIYVVQFHPESNQTQYGTEILLNFATNICDMQPEPDFTEETYRDRVVEQQAERVHSLLGSPDTRTVVFNSGGVDSATAHVLTHNMLAAIDRQQSISGIYINNGLMRHEDGDTIETMKAMGYDVEVQDWSQFFLHERVPLPQSEAKKRGYVDLDPMDSVVDPKIMRQIVKYGFIEAQRRIGATLRERFSDAEIIALVQGTNLADKIESGDFAGDQIKEHHNSGVEEFVDVLVEPLSSLFKGDIRKIAATLGFPSEITSRQPFPGPGLCLRMPANKTGETVWPADISAERKKLDEICRIVGRGALTGMWLPFQATGQKGDSRVHSNAVLLSGSYDPELIEKLAVDIPNSTSASRVLFTEQEVDPDRVTSVRQMVDEAFLDPLRDVEAAKSKAVRDTGLSTELSQHYVASLPISLSGGDRPTLMTRMFRTGVRSGLEDYITGEAALGGLNVSQENFQATLAAVETAASAFGYDPITTYDVTSKPPGTVELA